MNICRKWSPLLSPDLILCSISPYLPTYPLFFSLIAPTFVPHHSLIIRSLYPPSILLCSIFLSPTIPSPPVRCFNDCRHFCKVLRNSIGKERESNGLIHPKSLFPKNNCSLCLICKTVFTWFQLCVLLLSSNDMILHSLGADRDIQCCLWFLLTIKWMFKTLDVIIKWCWRSPFIGP